MTGRQTPPLPPNRRPHTLSGPTNDRRLPHQRPKPSPWWYMLLAVMVVVLLITVLTALVLSDRAGSAYQSLAVVVTSKPTSQMIVAQVATTSVATKTPRPTPTRAAPTVLPTIEPTGTPSPTPEPFVSAPISIGVSVQDRPLNVYRLGYGPRKRALIGAIHGGYEWNTADLMTKTLDYVSNNPDLIPPELTLYILPIANPDGYAAGHDATNGRVNGNKVDLNRNWDYQWGPTATHGTRPVSAGIAPFSEPETIALRDFIVNNEIEAVIFYHSALAKVFQGAGVTESKTIELAKLIADATGYQYSPEGVPGQITTGDAIDWLTVNGITAIEVELTTHQDLDWEPNLAGLRAFLTWDLPVAVSPAPPEPTAVTGTSTPAQTIYIVRPGDTLGSIALRFGKTVEEIAQANHLADSNFIAIGQELIVP